VGACGDRLNRMRQRPDGSYVRGADLYTTANSARDVAVLLNRLNPGKIDLYGDSYGTYFGQVFASRYPGRLRSLTLDSAYPVLGADPFYPDAITTARAAFDKVCARAPACAAAAPGSSWARISAFVSRLRTHPVEGVDVDTLIQLVLAAGADSGVYRELDPAIRAYEDRGDLVPLTRLVGQTIDPSEDGGAVAEFSSGLYVANFCNDYPQPFSYAASDAQRRNQYQAAVAALPANMFAPFTVQERVSSGSEEFDTCLKWPAPVTDDPPVVRTPPLTPNLPVLVLSGELDSLTTPADGRKVAEQMGPSARWVRVDTMYHVTAMLDFVDCAEGIVRRFIRIPPNCPRWMCRARRTCPRCTSSGGFPRTLAQTTPARRDRRVRRWRHGQALVVRPERRRRRAARRAVPVRGRRAGLHGHADQPPLDRRHPRQRHPGLAPGDRPDHREPDGHRAGNAVGDRRRGLRRLPARRPGDAHRHDRRQSAGGHRAHTLRA
jgi:pimeloyl-ACP methyl ester carboxylesterase